jgi:hypothetical protein
MKIVCAISIEELTLDKVDVLVLPEGIELKDIKKASNRFPETIVVSAAREGVHMRGYAFANGRNLIEYLKIETDGRSTGAGFDPENVIYLGDTFALAVLICMDIRNNYRLKVLDALHNSKKAVKILCVPADMTNDWFYSEPIYGWKGINVAVSNNNCTYPDSRAKSGISGTDGYWLERQVDCEHITVILNSQPSN